MDWKAFNLSATLNVFRLLARPSLCLPHATVSSFNQLPIPLNRAFEGPKYGSKVDIRAVVLDKDDCFAVPKQNTIYKPYQTHFDLLRQTYPGARLLIVSNTAGSSADSTGQMAVDLERSTGVSVLQHPRSKKPGCGPDIMEWFAAHPETQVTHPSQIAVVGDRLATDVVMANQMGAYAVWLKDGVVRPEEKSIFSRLEWKLAPFLQRYGLEPPCPTSPFE